MKNVDAQTFQQQNGKK